jgi:hypothetical protein
MKLYFFLFTSTLVFAADWDSVQRIPPAQRIEVTERGGSGRLRAECREIRVYDLSLPKHRVFKLSLHSETTAGLRQDDLSKG